MKIIGKLITLIIGIILGVVLTVGSVVGGYFYISTQKVSKIEELLKKDFGLTEEIRNLNMGEYINGVLGAVKGIGGDGTIGQLENAVGINIVSTKLQEYLGIDIALIKGSSLKNLPTTLIDNLTIDTVGNKFGVKFPDMPIFKDEAFRKKPLMEAFSTFDTLKMADFIKIVTDEEAANDPTGVLKPSSKILQKLGSEKIADISNNFDTIIGDTPLSDMIKVGDSYVWKYLGGTTINNMGKSIDDMMVKDIFEIKADSSAVLKKLTMAPADATEEEKLQYGDKEVKVVDLDAELDGVTKTLKIKDVLDIDENTTPILVSLQDVEIGKLSEEIDKLKLNQMVTIINDPAVDGYDPLLAKLANVGIKNFAAEAKEAINKCGLEDIIKIDDNSSLILKALKGKPLSDLSTTIDNLTFSQVIDTGSTAPKIFQALGDKKLNELGTSVNELKMSQIIDIPVGDETILSAIADLTLTNLASELPNKISSMSINKLFPTTSFNSGILSLISEGDRETTTVASLPNKLSTTMMGATLGQLKTAGIITGEVDNKIANKTLNDIITIILANPDLLDSPAIIS